jgi:hypothetical protein
MLNILAQSREAAPRLNRARRQRAPRVVLGTSDARDQADGIPQIPVAVANASGERSPRISPEAPLSIGHLLYLGSVGLVAAGIVAVFFGTGFLLLVPTGGETISGLAEQASSEVMPLPPPLGNDEKQTFFARASASESNEAGQSSAALPAPSETPAMDRKDDLPHLDGVLVSKAPIDTSAAPGNAPVPVPVSPAATALAATPGLSNTEMTELRDHGDALLRNGDVASARLFYERAAGAGDGRAALRLGATFDPEFLGRLGLGKLQANPAVARSWYSRARDLGGADAKRRLNSLETSRGKSFQ